MSEQDIVEQIEEAEWTEIDNDVIELKNYFISIDAKNEILSLREQLEALRKQTWQPIETAPHGVDLILYCPDRGITNEERIECGPYSTGKRIGNTSSMSYHSWATHWQPLPPSPQEQP